MGELYIILQIVSLSTVGTQARCLKLFFWSRVEGGYVDLQWPAGQGFACHLWMNATLLYTPGQED